MDLNISENVIIVEISFPLMTFQSYTKVYSVNIDLFIKMLLFDHPSLVLNDLNQWQ